MSFIAPHIDVPCTLETRPATTPPIDLAMVETALDRLRPFLRRDGRDIQVVGVSGRRLSLRIVGGGGLHPLALKQVTAGLERYLCDEVAGVEGVDLS